MPDSTPEPQEPITWDTISQLTPEQYQARASEVSAFIQSIVGQAGNVNRQELDRIQKYGPPSQEGSEPISWDYISSLTPEMYEQRRYDVQKFIRENMR